MKIEFELPDSYSNDPLLVCMKDHPTTVAYLNIYETGDVWLKTQGCEACDERGRELCCGKCPMTTLKGCLLHLTNTKNSDKPYRCVINPMPTDVHSWCALEFKCQNGKNKSKIRKVREPDTVK